MNLILSRSMLYQRVLNKLFSGCSLVDVSRINNSLQSIQKIRKYASEMHQDSVSRELLELCKVRSAIGTVYRSLTVHMHCLKNHHLCLQDSTLCSSPMETQYFSCMVTSSAFLGTSICGRSRQNAEPATKWDIAHQASLARSIFTTRPTDNGNLGKPIASFQLPHSMLLMIREII